MELLEDIAKIELETVKKLEKTNINPNRTFVRTAGYCSPGDGGGALYKRVSSEPNQVDKFQSEDGSWWAKVINPFVIFATGQSNFARESAISKNWNPPRNLNLWNGSYSTVGTNFISPRSDRMNCTWSFASAMAHDNPDRDIILINVSLAGRSIEHWLPNPLGEDIYAASVAAVNVALSTLGLSKIDLMLWWQGESNVNNLPPYTSQFEQVISRYRENDWFNNFTPIILFGTANSSVSGYSQFDDLNAVLKSIAASEPECRIYFRSSVLDTAYWADTLHLSGDGYKEAGELAYHQWSSATGSLNRNLVIEDDRPRIEFSANEDRFVRLKVANTSEAPNARASLLVEGTSSSFELRGSSGAVGGFFYTGTYFAIGINGSNIAHVTPEGLYWGGRGSGTPVSGNYKGSLLTGGQIVCSNDGAGSGYFNRIDGFGPTMGFFSAGTNVGSISVSPAGTSYNQTSDALLKVKESDLSFEDAKRIVELIALYNFTWAGTDIQDIGVFAQELYKIYPRAVTKGGWFLVNDDSVEVSAGTEGATYVPWSVDYSKLIPVIIRVLQGLLQK